ncbi:MAG: pyruvate formate-lyase-activating protein [Clostridia bacterium]
MTTLAQIHSYESFATLDGDGIRFAVFFVGCPLRCAYCHNPDTWTAHSQYEATAEQLCDKIARYKPYFKDNGGVTFSGGEPLLQAQFIDEIRPLLAEKNIKYALDTSGNIELSDTVKSAIDGADLIILDIKFWDKESYLRYTQGDIDKVLSFGSYVNSLGKRMWLRTVVVPAINDNTATIDKYFALTRDWKSVEKYELLAFHTMGFSKYTKLNIANPLANFPPLQEEKRQELQAYLDKLRRNNGKN